MCDRSAISSGGSIACLAAAAGSAMIHAGLDATCGWAHKQQPLREAGAAGSTVMGAGFHRGLGQGRGALPTCADEGAKRSSVNLTDLIASPPPQLSRSRACARPPAGASCRELVAKSPGSARKQLCSVRSHDATGRVLRTTGMGQAMVHSRQTGEARNRSQKRPPKNRPPSADHQQQVGGHRTLEQRYDPHVDHPTLAKRYCAWKATSRPGSRIRPSQRWAVQIQPPMARPHPIQLHSQRTENQT